MQHCLAGWYADADEQKEQADQLGHGAAHLPRNGLSPADDAAANRWRESGTRLFITPT
jgi:hypothetical protein